MNLLRSELCEHQKILDAFQELPADLRHHIQTFYQSIRPIPTCPYCNWAIIKPQWTIVSHCRFCFCVHVHCSY